MSDLVKEAKQRKKELEAQGSWACLSCADIMKLTEHLADALEAAESKPCPYVETSDEGTSYCRLSEDRVKQLEEENSRLRKALKPFADEAIKYHPSVDDSLILDCGEHQAGVTVGDLRKAAEVLK